MVVVKLDHYYIGAGPATVVAEVASVAEYLALATDRDGARDRTLRLWDGSYPVGTRVRMRLISGTGKGITFEDMDAPQKEER